MKRLARKKAAGGEVSKTPKKASTKPVRRRRASGRGRGGVERLAWQASVEGRSGGDV